MRDEYLSNRCLFNYNGVLYCYVYDNEDLLTSFKIKEDVLQCFNLQKLQNTEINNKEYTFKLFTLRKDSVVYLCILDDKQLLIIKSKQNTIQNEKVTKINGPRNYIILYNLKGEPCCIADISDNELEIVIY
jgi:hypothetical protein